MIRKMLLLGVCLVSLMATAAVAKEEYPPKPEAKTETTKAAVKAASVPKPLAKTGTDTAPMVLVAAGLIVVGGALVVSVRRRNSEAVPVS
ncbi:MAG: LPXTG cell wall anchor domain-containing protein [Acidimicrobiales bacterium]